MVQEVTLVTGSGSTPAGEGDFEAMLTVALDGIIELSGAERGLVLLFDEEGRVLLEKARTHERCDLDEPHLSVTRTVVEKVRSRGIAFRDDSAHQGTASLTRRTLKHLLVASVPGHKEGPCGLVYLDHSGAALSRETLMLARSLAQLVSVAATRGSGRSWRWRCVDATRWGATRWGATRWDVN